MEIIFFALIEWKLKNQEVEVEPLSMEKLWEKNRACQYMKRRRRNLKSLHGILLLVCVKILTQQIAGGCGRFAKQGYFHSLKSTAVSIPPISIILLPLLLLQEL